MPVFRSLVFLVFTVAFSLLAGGCGEPTAPTATRIATPSLTMTPLSSPTPVLFVAPTQTPPPTPTPVPTPAPRDSFSVEDQFFLDEVCAEYVRLKRDAERQGLTGPNFRVALLDHGFDAPTIVLMDTGCVYVPPAMPVTLHGLRVVEEHRCQPYNRDDYPYPQSVESEIVLNYGGIVYGPYTRTVFDNPQETDIEHIVALSEAHDSGLCAAPRDVKAQFAQDYFNLTLASPEVNRHQKGGKDVAEWLPAENQCWYVHRVVEVKREYGLGVDKVESKAIERVLAECESPDMLGPWS